MTCASKWQLAKSNFKINFLPQLLLVSVITFLTPMVFSMASLDEKMAAQPLEIMLSLTGIILFTPIFYPEQDKQLRDVIRSKKMNYLEIYLLRIATSLLTLLLIYTIFVGVMSTMDSQVSVKHIIDGGISALFLGMLGFMAAGFSNNLAVGYMVPAIYYVINFAGKEYLGHFFLFSMSIGSFSEKYYLFVASVIGMAFTLLLVFIKDQRS